MEHLIVSITWQEDYWQKDFTATDATKSNFGYVQDGNPPHERWNFSLEHNVRDGYKFGFFQARNQPTRFVNGKGIVFFASRRQAKSYPAQSYIVGLYAGAELGWFPLERQPGVELDSNVRAPVENVLRWDSITALPLDNERHLGKKRIGQVNFNYVQEDVARNILEDAIAAHQNNPEKQEKLREVLALYVEDEKQQVSYFIERCVKWQYDKPFGEVMTAPKRQADGTLNGSSVLLTEMKPNDVVLHLRNVDAGLVLEGISRVKEDYRASTKEEDDEYLVSTKDYEELQPKLKREEILESSFIKPVLQKALAGSVRPLFFDKNLKLASGFYFSRAPLNILRAWNSIYKNKTGQNLPHLMLDETEVPPMPDSLTQRLLGLSIHTRNMILYGPPGTGKTFAAKRFVEALLAEQAREGVSEEGRMYEAVKDLTWHEVIALTLYLKGKDAFHKPTSFTNAKLLEVYAASKTSQNLTSTVHTRLGKHTSLENEYVKIKERRSPYLFEKNAEREWALSNEGRDYVEEELEATLAQVSTPSGQNSIEAYTEFVTFHQSFSYEEFIEGLKPVLDSEDDVVRYEIAPGIFQTFCERARLDAANKYVIIIDEINRANIAKVFGELITLLEDDKRLGEANAVKVRLAYSKRDFGVPNNLYVVGTMNTADRSIALLDIALRRRFAFVEVMPRLDILDTVELNGDTLELGALLDTLNTRITELLDKNFQIGHSYLLDIETLEQLRFAWEFRLVPLLEEYFYGDAERLREVLGNDFVTGADDASEGSGGYTLARLDEQAFGQALLRLAASGLNPTAPSA